MTHRMGTRRRQQPDRAAPQRRHPAVTDPPAPARSRSFTPLDGLLLLMAIIWGTNFSIIKSAIRELQPHAFNAVRMAVASAAFLLVLIWARLANRGAGSARAAEDGGGRFAGVFHTPEKLTGRDWVRLAVLGIIGHVIYQFFFIGGLARTSVAYSSLMLAVTPVLIAVISAIFGHERI